MARAALFVAVVLLAQTAAQPRAQLTKDKYSGRECAELRKEDVARVRARDPGRLCRWRRTDDPVVRARNDTVLLVHIRKAGGTTICEWAKAAGFVIPVAAYTSRDQSSYFSKNCNPTHADSKLAWGASGPEAMAAYARARGGVDFYAIEAKLPTALPLGDDGFRLAVILRHPLRLLFSQCGNHMHDSSKEGKLLDCMRARANFQTSTLVGKIADAANATLSRAHVEVAKNLLDSADVVLLTETLGQAPAVLEDRLDWPQMDVVKRAGTHKHWIDELPGADAPGNITKALMAHLEGMFGVRVHDFYTDWYDLDRELYMHAEAIWDRQVADLGGRGAAVAT